MAGEGVSKGEAVCRLFHQDLHVDQFFDHGKKVVFFQPGEGLQEAESN